ncbi:hypothetical protein AA11237_2342 [Acidocella aminolytica 101 = DSM 11237]|nr:hypothetical protein AA11237_2342 [Acidocella aminolytica 101 = DSM 11237]
MRKNERIKDASEQAAGSMTPCPIRAVRLISGCLAGLISALTPFCEKDGWGTNLNFVR